MALRSSIAGIMPFWTTDPGTPGNVPMSATGNELVAAVGEGLAQAIYLRV
jgi:hypothetical protein